MSKCTIFVGLDYHDSGVQMCVLDDRGQVLSNRMCPNDWHSLRVAVSEFGPDADIQAGIEACNGAVDLALELGLVTAVTLRAEIGRFDRFRTGKQLARFCGVSPRNASSGRRQADAGLIKAGNSELRCVLIETAHRLRNFTDRWADFAVQMKRRGKPSCVIAAAIANRWVRKLFHEMKDLGLSLAG